MTIFNYTVNYIDLIIVGLVLLFTILGYTRGLFITLVNFLRYVFGFSFCIYASDRFTQPIYDNFAKERIVDSLSKKVVTSTNIDEISTNLKNFIESMPAFLKSGIDMSTISFKSGDDIAVAISDNIFQPVALVVIKAVVFIITFILFFGITGAIIAAIRHHRGKNNKKSVLKKTDRILGSVLGLAKGVIVTFVLVFVISFVSDIEALNNSSFINEALNSGIYNFIIDINPYNIITEGII